MNTNKKFSVIIPTMWFSNKIKENLHRLNNCDEVYEIILIDNNISLTPEYINDYEKIKYLPQKQNIYVNPAWNLGIEKAKCQNICISNDDVIFDTSVFSFIENYIDIGIYGMSTSNYYPSDPSLEYKVEKIEIRPWGWGCLFFIKKENWTPINKDLKIACGDDWLIKYTKGGAYQIENLNLNDDKVSVTSIRNEFSEIQKKDIEIWSQYLR